MAKAEHAVFTCHKQQQSTYLQSLEKAGARLARFPPPTTAIEDEGLATDTGGDDEAVAAIVCSVVLSCEKLVDKCRSVVLWLVVENLDTLEHSDFTV